MRGLLLFLQRLRRFTSLPIGGSGNTAVRSMKQLETYKADVAALTGYPVKVQTAGLSGQLSGIRRWRGNVAEIITSVH